MKGYYSPKETCEKLGIHFQTLRNWSVNGKINYLLTPSGRRYYKQEDVEAFMEKNEIQAEKEDEKSNEEDTKRRNICYCRVSTHSQKIELENQINYMKEKYNDYEILHDIGSGINFNRKNLNKIIDYAINNELNELVIAYKDRLCRIGFELIETILKKYSNTKITILNNEVKSPEEELTNDLIEIVTVFSSKLHGMRSYKNKKKE